MKQKTLKPKSSKKTKTAAAPQKEETIKQLGPFDFVKSIQSSKIDLIRESVDKEAAEKAYVPWVVNKALSNYIDSVLHANEMNACHDIDNKYQNDYYLHSVRSAKRQYVWNKSNKSADIEAVAKYFGYNNEKASEALLVLSSADVEYIKTAVSAGGVHK